MKARIVTLFTIAAALLLLASSCNLSSKRAPVGTPPSPQYPWSPTGPGAGAYDVWTDVWCPDAQDSGRNFRPVASLEDLPVHPLGDGVNNCYMAAFDTSRFSSDGRPVSGCDNLDPNAFGGGYTCYELRTAEDFKGLRGDRIVGIVMNDITGIERLFVSTARVRSMVLLGTYDPANLRPVLLQGKVKLSWQSRERESNFTVFNLRIRSTETCFATTTNPSSRITLTLQSVSGKCAGRFIMQSSEALKETENTLPRIKAEYLERTGHELVDLDGDGMYLDDADRTVWPVDDRTYFRNVLAMGGQSHTLYLGHNYLNWIQDSIIMTPINKGKHAAKLVGQYNVVHNSIFSNVGLHNEPLVDDDPDFLAINPHPKDGGMASLSMISCTKNVIDRVTLFHRFGPYSPGGGHSNIDAMLWQLRPEIGAGCDLPFSHTPFSYGQAYRGPAYYPDFFTGRRFDASPYWTQAFWDRIDRQSPWTDPHMLTSFVTGVDLRFFNAHEPGTGEKEHYDERARPAAVTSVGTYPTAQNPSNANFNRFEFDEAPPWWKERMRVVFNNNAFDQGIRHATDCGPIGPNPSSSNPHLDPELHAELAATQKCFFVGPNTRSALGEVDPEVREGRNTLIGSLPPPHWLEW